MCPPPAEPIRPVGPLDSTVYVERTDYATGVTRRRRRQDDQPPEQGRQRNPWKQAEHPYDDAGGYDDHGRAHPHEDDDPDEHHHVDTTA